MPDSRNRPRPTSRSRNIRRRRLRQLVTRGQHPSWVIADGVAWRQPHREWGLEVQMLVRWVIPTSAPGE